MKSCLSLIALLLMGCQNPKPEAKEVAPKTPPKENPSVEAIFKRDEKYLDSIYHCENDQFSSTLEEIPNTDTNAYKITITSKKDNSKFSKLLDVRPQMSKISYCNELYTVVGFPCGGPCYSRVFVFTDKNRPNEQYAYPQEVKNDPTIIGHIEDEKFEKLIIHNFLNNKEMVVDISDMNYWNSGQADSMVVKHEKLILYYESVNNKRITKSVSLKPIL